ncbi:MAG: hypothetical protein A2138_04350 [Deltaproteobacteria bacterium RBG_16_71_12]|nr:MAG: hypothetical protein A2138_04350 [Deltaproteobacteria bacterium RBG_16_71_12]
MSRSPLPLHTAAPEPLALDDVLRHLDVFPADARLRAFCAQLARREGRFRDVQGRLGGRRGRRFREPLPDGLALFTGALAVTETLQLDAFALDDDQIAAERPATDRTFDVADVDETGDTFAVAVGFAAVRMRLFVRVTDGAVLIGNTMAALDGAGAGHEGGEAHACLHLTPSRQHHGAARARFARCERARRACFAALGRAVLSQADGARFRCPSGGRLVPGDDGVRCTAHGHPRRPANAPGGDAAGLELHDLTARLVFEEGGVRAIVQARRIGGAIGAMSAGALDGLLVDALE